MARSTLSRRAPRGVWLPLVATAVALVAPGTPAQTPAPPPPRVVPAPQDVPYPGVITLEVDLTDLDHRVFDVVERLPVAGPGPLTVLYPRWLPGNHGPTGPIQSLAGLVVTAPGTPARRLDWQRDPLNMFAFHLDVPDGVRELELRFQFVTPATSEQGRRTVAADLLGLQWEKALLYPAGHYARQVTRAAVGPAAGGLGVRERRAGRLARRRSRAVRAAQPRAAGRFAAVRGSPRAPLRARRRSARPGAPERVRRSRRAARGHAGPGRGPSPAGARGAAPVRRAPLPALRLPARAQRRVRRHRPRAPPVERERRRSRLLHRLGGHGRGARPAAARVRALLERQVPAPGGPVDAGLRRRDAQQPAVGLRGHDRVLGHRAGGAIGPVERVVHARGARAPCRHLRPGPRRSRVAQPAGHDQPADHGLSPGAAVPELAAQHRLLHRERAVVARRGYAAARADARPALAG